MESAKVNLKRGKTSWAWVVERCPYCGKRHQHGGGSLSDNPREHLGSRLAHCVRLSALDSHSYILVESEEPA